MHIFSTATGGHAYVCCFDTSNAESSQNAIAYMEREEKRKQLFRLLIGYNQPSCYYFTIHREARFRIHFNRGFEMKFE